MKNLKKVLSLILAISMVTSLCTFVFAEDETTQAEMQIDGGAAAKYLIPRHSP